MKVALEPAQPGVGRLDRRGARGLERADPRCEERPLVGGQKPAGDCGAPQASPWVSAAASTASRTPPTAMPARATPLNPPSSDSGGAADETADAAMAASAVDHAATATTPLNTPTGPSRRGLGARGAPRDVSPGILGRER